MKMNVLWMEISSIPCRIWLYRFFVSYIPQLFFIFSPRLHLDQRSKLSSFRQKKNISPRLIQIQAHIFSLLHYSIVGNLLDISIFHIPRRYFHSCNVYISVHQCLEHFPNCLRILFGRNFMFSSIIVATDNICWSYFLWCCVI